MKVFKVWARKNDIEGYAGVYYQVGDNTFLIHRGYQKVCLKSFDALEEITNKAVISSLIADHNIILMDAINKSAQDNHLINATIRQALMDALLEMDSFNGNGTYPCDFLDSTKKYLLLQPMEHEPKPGYEWDKGLKLAFFI